MFFIIIGTFDEARKWLPKATTKSDFSEAEITLPRLRARDCSDQEETSPKRTKQSGKKRRSKHSLAGPSHKLSLVSTGDKPVSPLSASSSSLDSLPSFDELLSRYDPATINSDGIILYT